MPDDFDSMADLNAKLESLIGPAMQMQGLQTVCQLVEGAHHAHDLAAYDIEAQLLKRARALLTIGADECGPRPALPEAVAVMVDLPVTEVAEHEHESCFDCGYIPCACDEVFK